MNPNKPTTFRVINGMICACIAIKGWILGPKVNLVTTIPEGYSCDELSYVIWCAERGIQPGYWSK